jgi:hypothetical protein
MVNSTLSLLRKLKNEIPIFRLEDTSTLRISTTPSINPMDSINYSLFTEKIASLPYREKDIIMILKDQLLSLMTPEGLFNLYLSVGDYSMCMIISRKSQNLSILKKLIIRIGFQLLYLKNLIIEGNQKQKNFSQRETVGIQKQISTLMSQLDKIALIEEKFIQNEQNLFKNKNEIKLLILEVLLKINQR